MDEDANGIYRLQRVSPQYNHKFTPAQNDSFSVSRFYTAALEIKRRSVWPGLWRSKWVNANMSDFFDSMRVLIAPQLMWMLTWLLLTRLISLTAWGLQSPSCWRSQRYRHLVFGKCLWLIQRQGCLDRNVCTKWRWLGRRRLWYQWMGTYRWVYIVSVHG